MRVEFGGRHVVVTGASGELGAAVARALVGAGASVHAPVRGAVSPDAIVPGAAGQLTVAAGIELSDERSVVSFFAGLPSLWGSVHCAGAFDMAPVAEISADRFARMWSANATTCFLASREAVRSIRAAGGGGRIVNVAALPAVEPRRGAGMTAYAASKAAVAVFTQALAEELAGEGIWVNAVVPSTLDTEANRRAMPASDHDRWAKLPDVAATIAFLASPQNTVTRGALVPVYGRG